MPCSQVVTGALALVLLALALLAGAALASVVVEVPAPHLDAAEKTLVVDTDAGADDALAILELLLMEKINPKFKTVAITCVQGNTGVENVTKNVLATLKIVDRLDVPVYTGAAAPLLPPQPAVDPYFGSDGFGDFLAGATVVSVPDPLLYVPEEPAAVALVKLAKKNPGQLSLVCIGPLTNVALAARLDPSFLDNLRELFILGGAARGNGNTAPGTEFNVHGDPGAFAAVLGSVKTPVYLMPWETVLGAELPMMWRIKVLGKLQSLPVQFLNYAEAVSLPKMTGWTSGDGLMAAFVIDPTVAAVGRAVRVQVLVGEGPGRGVTLVDHSNTTALPGNAVLIEQADPAAFRRVLLTLLNS
ncbi:hypothetical protein KUF71_021274 [Frankliniella fusca]|uniref:Inosine/uridine-preferring nucleoside hydrolase domain-containing protein n=1 Tax=Frankliniella fusca TaxID=407009 RepID=A0AAE1L9P6_9NEOP|nr:hypothetical protein KUF71_021274 [Frankliniella fusca]